MKNKDSTQAHRLRSTWPAIKAPAWRRMLHTGPRRCTFRRCLISSITVQRSCISRCIRYVSSFLKNPISAINIW